MGEQSLHEYAGAVLGLRVLMAVINNWDLKDSNNSIYQILLFAAIIRSNNTSLAIRIEFWLGGLELV